MRVTQQRAIVAASNEGSVKARCQVLLRLAGYSVNAKRVRRLVRPMGQESVHLKPRLSVAGQDSMRHPYLLREQVLYAPHEFWSTDITYVPKAKGVLYLVTVIDWHTHYVLSWELSNTLDVGFCRRTLATHPAPYIFNSDQGSQFFAQALPVAAVKPAATGRATDNAFIERYGVPSIVNASTSTWQLTIPTYKSNCTPTSLTPPTSAPTKSSTAKRRSRSSPKSLLVSSICLTTAS
jgi:transposase InsO family protein